jgi:hypothetical protein
MPTSSTAYDNLRENINPAFASLSDEQLQTLMERSGADAEMMEGFFDDLGKFASSAGQAVLKAAPAILPVAGSIVGTAFGGPLGASLGNSLGSLAGKAIGSATGQAPGSGGGGGGLGGLLGGAGGLGGLVSSGLGAVMGGSPAAGQLLQTITKPETMQALASMAMGAMGKPNIPVGGTSVPVGAFGNLLKMLTGRVEAEYAEAMARSEGDGTPGYMRDFSGQAVSDPAVPQNRAVALYELLQSSERDDEQDVAELDAEADAAEQEMAALQAEYDEMELAEVYDSEEA